MPDLIFSQIPVDDLIEKIKDAVKSSLPPPGEFALAAAQDNRLYGQQECANYLNCSRNTVYILIKAKKIPHYKIGIHYFFLKSELDDTFRDQTRRFAKNSRTFLDNPPAKKEEK